MGRFCNLGTIFVFMALALPLRAGELVLAEKGTVYTIVVSGNAIKPETYAAEELAGYLKKVTGVPFRVVKDVTSVDKYRIIVGQNALSRKILGEETISGLAEEEFIIRTEGSDLLIVGGRPRGTLYGVYEFLEKYVGCRFLNWWGEEYVPQRENLAVSTIDRRQSPAFRVRDIVVHTNPYANREVLRNFLVRNRCQGPELNFTGGMDTYGGTTHTYVVPPHIVHTSFWLISPLDGQIPDIFAKHPEYFTFNGSKRTPSQLCFSNPGVRKILTERILDRFEEVGGKGTLSLSAQDSSSGPLCECPDCLELIEREHTPGAPLFDFLAELGPILKRKYPEAFISTIAYRRAQTEVPPQNITLPENVIIIFAPIDNNFGAPFEDQSNEETFENIKAWTSATKHLWVWYYTNPYCEVLPIGNLENTAKDFRFFRKIGVEGFFLQHDAGVAESYRLADLQTWLLTKLMWNPDQNFNTLIEDFTNHFYGKAAPFIRKYLYALEKATQEMTTPMSWRAPAGEYRFLTPEFLVALQKTFAQAEEVVLNDPVLLLRVRQARMSLDRASILFWGKLAAIPNSGLERKEIARRYRDTYQKTIEKIPQNRPDASGVEDFLRPRLMMNPTLKPLPAPLNEIPEGKAQQVTPDFAIELSAYFPPATIEKDPDSAAGITVARVPGSELPFNLGYYDEITKRQLHRNITENEICSSGYNLYKIGRTTLNEQCTVWIGSSWVPQFPVSAFYDVQDPEKEWDIYASLRFEGPTYPHGQKGTVDRVFVDRVVLVPVGE
ncbi:MAG: DUF4838 domain-containing protein [Candidatus Omnitrophota bacterium]